MGQSLNIGLDNDELIDSLVQAEYIRTIKIQRIFRAVDRANYFLEGQKEIAYRDIAWREGNLHLSAPCVYSRVMESLKLRSGLSFLNLGSGCGYLSTMAGLILGPYGINHGIEINNDVIDYAYEKLEEFLKQSDAVDEFDFCEPVFLNGNCLKIDNIQLYDRVYCGAACPPEYETYMKHLIRVGGVLVMPLNDRLLKITRTDTSTWEYGTIFTVSFAPLLMSPSDNGSTEFVKLPEFSPPPLQILCRSKIRAIFRSHINEEYPNLHKSKLERCTKAKRCHRRQIMIPLFHVTDSSDTNSDAESQEFVELQDSRTTITVGRLPAHATDLIRNLLCSRRRDFLEAGPSNVTNKTNNNSEEETISEENKNKTKEYEFMDSSSTDTDSDSSFSDPSDDTDDKYEDCTISHNTPDLPKPSTTETSVKTSRKRKSTPKKESQRKRQCPDSKYELRKKRVTLIPKKNNIRNQFTSVVYRRFPASEIIAATQLKNLGKETKPSNENSLNYCKLMAKKIMALPLPSRIQMFINYRRDNMNN